jgi:uncharacterized membrane protein
MLFRRLFISTVLNSKVIVLSGDLDFGTVALSSTTTKTLRVTNSGTVNLTLNPPLAAFSFSDPHYSVAAYAIGKAVIAPGDYEDFTIKYMPGTDVGSHPCTITVGSDKTAGTNTIAATGSTLTKVIALSGSMAFGSTIDKNAIITKTLRITNNGLGTLTVSSISYPSGYSGAWSGTIAAGAYQDVTVSFQSATTGTFNGTITVNSDKTSGTNTVSATATVTAKKTLRFTPSSLTFGSVAVGSSVDINVSVRNDGDTTLYCNSAGIATSPSPFSVIASNNIPYLAPGGSAWFCTVRFAPTSVDSFSTRLTWLSDCTNTSEVNNTPVITGTGV